MINFFERKFKFDCIKIQRLLDVAPDTLNEHKVNMEDVPQLCLLTKNEALPYIRKTTDIIKEGSVWIIFPF